MTTNDKDIIQVMREDAEKGFRLLMKSYKEPLYWHIRRLVVSHDDAQDAAQETFIRIFRSFGQYSEANSLRAWLFLIATNEALRLLGRQKSATMLSLDDVTADMLSAKADTATEAEAEQANKARMEQSQKILALREKYYVEYSKFLTQRQIERAYELEQQVMRRLARHHHRQGSTAGTGNHRRTQRTR